MPASCSTSAGAWRKIRVFDPACGSGNFLGHRLRGDARDRGGESFNSTGTRRTGPAVTEIPLTNFRGIELRDFPPEIARLALIIAEFQCDVLYRGRERRHWRNLLGLCRTGSREKCQ